MKKMLQNWALKHLFQSILIEDVITVDRTGKIIMLDGEIANDTELNNLHNEAQMFKSMRLYKILTNTLRQQAESKMFKESKSWEDMIAGKMMLHSIGIIENIVKILIQKP